MPTVGLDLGQQTIRAIELDKNVITRFGSYENPVATEATEDEKLEAYSNVLKTFFSEVGFSTPNVVIGLEESNVFMRIITVPQMNDKDLKNAIMYEAEQHIPLPIKEVSLSYKPLGIDFKDKTKMQVQIVAAKQQVLEKYVEMVKNARLMPKAIEPETLAMGRVLGDTEALPVGTIILDMGHLSSLIVVVHGGHVRFTRAVAIGGLVISKSLQQQLALDSNQADEYKKVYGLDRTHFEGKIYDVIKPIIDSIIAEIKRASLFFTNNNPSATIKRVILTGGTALMPGLLYYVANNLDLEVELANPLKGLEISSRLKDKANLLKQQAPLFSTAIGLALKEV